MIKQFKETLTLLADGTIEGNIPAVYDKINEIINAINLLEKKVQDKETATSGNPR